MGQTIEAPRWTANNEDFRLPAPRSEIDGRRDAVLLRMQEEGIDVAVFTTPQSIFYLTGIKLGFAYYPLVLDSSGGHRFLNRLIDAGWQEVWAHQTWADQWHQFRDEEDVDEVTAAAVRSIHARPIGRIGFELDRPSVSYSSVRRVSSLLGAEDVVSSTALVEDLRVIKSDSELELMRRAGLISAKASDAIADSIRSGASDAEAASIANTVVTEAGGMAAPWPPFVMTGASGGTGHLPWARMTPQPGDAVTWYVSGFVHGYACPIERTIVREPDASGIGSMVGAVATVVEHLIENLRPGMTSAEAYAVALDAHQQLGFERYWRNHAGYGVGIQWTEFDLMRLRPNDDRTLRPGMTLHLVPCLTVPGLTNAQASKVVVITESGAEPLSDYPLRLPNF